MWRIILALESKQNEQTIWFAWRSLIHYSRAVLAEKKISCALFVPALNTVSCAPLLLRDTRDMLYNLFKQLWAST